MAFKLGGHLPDPDDGEALGNYWDFDTQLRPHLAGSAGDADLRPYSSPRHKQANTSSCVAQSVVKALENLERQKICRDRGIDPERLGPADHQNLSVLYLYYMCRESMRPSRVHEDSGTYVSLACERLSKLGVCTEELWPFDEDKLFEAPSYTAVWNGYDHKISAYYRIKQTGTDRVQSVIEALRSSHPVVYGTEVDDHWSHYRAGRVLQPATERLGRGHATHLVGWDEGRGVFIGENSWGNGWGDDGYYLMAPEAIADPISQDFWVITGQWEEVHR